MADATREEYLALAFIPVENAKGIGHWKRAWVPWLGGSHRGFEQTGCRVPLLTHMSADESCVYLMHGESMFVLEAHGAVKIESDGSAWIEVIGSERPWLARIHTAPSEGLSGIHAAAREWRRL